MLQRLKLLRANCGTFYAFFLLAATTYLWWLCISRAIVAKANPEFGLLAVAWFAGLLIAVLARGIIRTHPHQYRAVVRPVMYLMMGLLFVQVLFDVRPLGLWFECVLDVVFSAIIHSMLWFFTTFEQRYALPHELESSCDPFSEVGVAREPTCELFTCDEDSGK